MGLVLPLGVGCPLVFLAHCQIWMRAKPLRPAVKVLALLAGSTPTLHGGVWGQTNGFFPRPKQNPRGKFVRSKLKDCGSQSLESVPLPARAKRKAGREH